MIPSEFLLPYVTTNIVALAFIGAAGWRPRVMRWVLAAMFTLAAFFNGITGIIDPQSYLTYADTTVLAFYREFILGAFSRHTTPFVLAIACGQLITGILLTQNGNLFRLGVLFGMLFMIAILPLGIGSAAPSSLFFAAAIYITFRRLHVPSTGRPALVRHHSFRSSP